jgi:hypothetical protein
LFWPQLSEDLQSRPHSDVPMNPVWAGTVGDFLRNGAILATAKRRQRFD